MKTSFSPAQFDQFRRDAKRLSKREGILYGQALDRIAGQYGYSNWSLLHKNSASNARLSSNTAAPLASLALPTATVVAPSRVPSVSPASVMDSRKRYYFHGDQHEDSRDLYYCSSCDVFFQAGHFASHGRHTGERTLERLERWEKDRRVISREYQRPANAVNMLEAQARTNRQEYQRMRLQFSDWLRARGKNSPIFDVIAGMAASISSPRGLPKRPKSLQQLREHYESYGKGSLFGIGNLEAAWDEFKEQLP